MERERESGVIKRQREKRERQRVTEKHSSLFLKGK